MKSVYNWNYLKSEFTLSNVSGILLHVIDFQFFRTVIDLAMKPSQLIESRLAGHKKYQNPLSFYLSALFFLFLVSFISNKLFSKSLTQDSGYMHYVLTVPFIFVISVMNYLLFKRPKLNYLSHLIVTFYIIGQTIFYLIFYYFLVEYLLILNESVTMALIYSSIIFMNLFIINYRTFKRSLLATFLKSLLIIIAGIIFMSGIAQFL